MRATVVLIKWQDGYAEAGPANANLRIEIFQGQAGDRDEAILKAEADLGLYGLGQTEITVGAAMLETDPVPGVDLIPGNEITVDGADREIETWTMTLDDESNQWVDVPQFGQILDGPTERIDRMIGSYGGLTKGTSKTARPTSSITPWNVRPEQPAS